MKVVRTVLKPIAAALVLAVMAVAGVIAYHGVPVTDAPGIGHRLYRYLTGATVATQPFSAYPELTTPSYPREPQRVYAAARQAVKTQGWTLVSADEEALMLTATATSTLLGIRSEITAWVTTNEEGLSLLNIRATPRGQWPDLGANTKWVMALKQEVSQRL